MTTKSNGSLSVPSPEPGAPGGPKWLIVNADDFGASAGINRGIVDCHTRGVVTSTSLMVTGRAARDAAVLSRRHPALPVGWHWGGWGAGVRGRDTTQL